MIDYDKLITFCTTYNLEVEEFLLLYTLHIRNQNSTPEIYPLMDVYYKNKEINWSRKIRSLEEREFLIILKEPRDGKTFLIKDLQITDKFVSLLFINPDDIWKKFVSRYPRRGLSPTGSSDFGSNVVKEGDKEYFIKNILKNADKIAADKIISLLEEMFDWDDTKKECQIMARYGISRFMLNWDEFVRQHEENESGAGSFTYKSL